MRQLRRRILQPTADLMAEVSGRGNMTPCGAGQFYAFKDQNAPVLAVAHCDYVDCGSNHFLAHKGKVWSSRLDDRLGVYVILDVLPALGIDVDILLTDDEEKGQSTAQFFDPANHHNRAYNWIVQFDRRGMGAVCYDYDAIEPYVQKCFKLDYGSFSDICWLEHLGVCGLNVGTAYYNEHTLGSYAVMAQLRDQLRRFSEFYALFANERIAHVPCVHGWNKYDIVSAFDELLEWHDCGSGLFYAEGLGRDEYEICYVHDESFGYPWRLSTIEIEEWFKTLNEAKEAAQQMYDCVR